MRFDEASLAIVLRTVQPVIDMFSNGAASHVVDAIGDRGAAVRIVGEQLAELGAAMEDAARKGWSEELIHRCVTESQDVPRAVKLLAHPAEPVELNGRLVVADDDVPDPNLGDSTSDQNETGGQ